MRVSGRARTTRGVSRRGPWWGSGDLQTGFYQRPSTKCKSVDVGRHGGTLQLDGCRMLWASRLTDFRAGFHWQRLARCVCCRATTTCCQRLFPSQTSILRNKVVCCQDPLVMHGVGSPAFVP